MYPNISSCKGMHGSTKDQIARILSYNWPLAIKKIYFLLKKEYGRKVTYQAVYKALNQMLESRILLKTKQGYQLNLDWVKEIHNQTEIMRVNYFAQQKTVLIDKSGKADTIRVFIFKTWFDVEKYLYYFQKNHILNSKEKNIICAHHAHEWRPLFYMRAEHNWVNQLNKLGHRIFTLCSGNSALDKWSSGFYNRIGSYIKINKNVADTCELMVFADFVIQVYIPEHLREALDNICKKTKNIGGFNHALLIKNIFEKETAIKVIINKDKKIAEQIKKQTMAYFKQPFKKSLNKNKQKNKDVQRID